MQAKNRCEYCGAIIPPSTTTCPNCGAPVETILEPPLVAESSSSPSDKSLLSIPQNTKNAELFLSQYAERFPKDKLLYIKDILIHADQAIIDELSSMKFYNPSTIQLVSFLCGGLGVDRFLLRQYPRGIMKLSLLFLGYLLEPVGCVGVILNTIPYLGTLLVVMILWIKDAISAKDLTKEYNYKILMENLYRHKQI